MIDLARPFLLIAFFSFIYIYNLDLFSHSNSITFFNVGQGDAIYIKSADDKRILIDAGPSNNLSEHLGLYFFPFLCRFDYVIITHPHEDHVGGLSNVFSDCRVGEVIMPKFDYNSLVFQKILETIRSKNIPILHVEDKQKIIFNDFVLYFLSPDYEFLANETNPNNFSIVLLLDSFAFEALLMGDLEKEGQEKIDINFLKELVDGHLDVIKVAHHGAKDSLNEKFLENFEIDTAVISVGKNKFGHPHKEVLEFYNKNASFVTRTDFDNNIRFSF